MAADRLKVLLIEHDPGFARELGSMLSQAHDLSAEVIESGDLHAGLSAVGRNHWDVVLVDLSVPDGAGLANVGLIRSRAPDVPVIVAGESDDETVAVEAVQAGAQDYLVKGQLTPGWLERSVRYAIERHRMDRSLQEAEEKYHSLFDHLVEGIFRTTPDGHYLMANAALARIYGYASPDELIEQMVDIGNRLYVDPGRRDEFVRLMQQHDVITGFESRAYRKDGAVIWMSENCRAIRDDKGQLLYYEGTVEDITQRRQAEEKLLHSEALYHSLVETLPQNIFRKNLDGCFTFANQQFCRSLGRPLEQIVGRTDYDFFPPELAAKYQADDRRVIETGQPYETVEEHQPPGADTMFVQVVKTPLRGADGTIIGLQAIFWDITEQRRAQEEIRQANIELANSRQELRARNLQMQDDLNMAREIQLTMLPQQYPVFPRGASPEASVFQFNHRYLPTGSLGGDFFTVSALPDDRAAVFLCDVTGHGVRSALITAMVRALVEELKPVAHSPGEFLSKLNVDLCAILRHTGTPLLTTAFYLTADPRTGIMQYANAGHPKPFHLRRSQKEVVALANAAGRSQPALGLVEHAVYQSTEVRLTPGDLLFLFTDGLVEVEDGTGRLFSVEELMETVRDRMFFPVPRLFDGVLDHVREFAGTETFEDDVCLLGLEFCARGGNAQPG